MTTLRLLIAAVFIIFSIAMAFVNLAAILANRRNRQSGIPPNQFAVPFLTVFSSAVAYLLYPETPKLWILALPTLDIGNWIVVLGRPYTIVTGMFRRPSSGKTKEKKVS